MGNFFYSLYTFHTKQKRKVFVVFFVLVLVGILSPGASQAASWGQLIIGQSFGPAGQVASGAVAAYEGIDKTLQGTIKAFIGAFLLIPLFLSELFSLIVETLLKWIISANIPYAASTAVITGWPIVRNLANMLVVLALIIISLATILRFEDYKAKKLLPSLIIAALLINFSLVLCGILIDGSNIAMKSFLAPEVIGDGLTDNNSGAVLKTSEQAIKDVFNSNINIIAFVMKTIGAIFYNMASAIVLMLYLFLFLFRVFALWVLLILSPLAFACYPLPYTRKFFGMWWNNFLQWCIIGIAGGFFYYIASKLHNQLAIANPPLNQSDSITAGLADLFSFIVPGAFLVIGFLFSLQTSAMGASIAISGFRKTRDALRTGATATGKYVGKKAADRFGVTRARNAIVDTTTGFLEKRGFIKANTTLANQQKRLETKKTEFKLSTDQELAKKANAKTGRLDEKARLEKAAAAELLAERKKLNLIEDPVAREEAARHAVSYGAKKSAFTDTHPELLTVTDEEAKQSLIAKEKAKQVDRLISTGNYTKEEAEKRADKAKGIQPTELEIATEKERLHKESIKGRTLGYGPVGDKEAERRALDDTFEKYLNDTNPATGQTNRKDIEDAVEAQNSGVPPEQLKIAMQKAFEDRKAEYGKKKPSTPSEILKAKEDLTKERGTPEAAANNETEIGKLVATFGITREEAQARLLKRAHAASKIDTTDATDEEVLEKATKETSEGAKYLKEAMSRGILHLIEEGSREKAVKNATRLGDRVEALAKEDYRYEEYNEKAVNVALIKAENKARVAAGGVVLTPDQEKSFVAGGATPLQVTEAKKAVVKAKLKENLSRGASNEQLRRISPAAHLSSDIVSELSIKQIQAFEGEPTTTQHLKNLITTAVPPYKSLTQLAVDAQTAGDNNEAKRIRRIIRTIQALP